MCLCVISLLHYPDILLDVETTDNKKGKSRQSTDYDSQFVKWRPRPLTKSLGGQPLIIFCQFS